MADKIVVFSEKDVAVLKEMVKWWRTFTHRDEDEKVDHQHASPETYIALVPSGGISANNNPALSGSTASLPGSAVCNIFQINSAGELVEIVGLSKIVYNISTSAVSSGWIAVTRDKFGRWLALVSGSAASGGFLATAITHVYQSTVVAGGTVQDSIGNNFDIISPLGDVVHGAYVWVERDANSGAYTAINTSCPTGTST